MLLKRPLRDLVARFGEEELAALCLLAARLEARDLADHAAQVDAPHGVALYCMIGPRARMGESALLAAGYESVFHLEGGFSAWQAAGLPVETAK